MDTGTAIVLFVLIVCPAAPIIFESPRDEGAFQRGEESNKEKEKIKESEKETQICTYQSFGPAFCLSFRQR